MTSHSDRRAPAARRQHQNNLSNYGLSRARDKAFDAVRALWSKRQSNGVKLKDVADKIGADKGWVSKQLRGPGNWTLRTFGALVEGMDGEIEIGVFPIEEASDARSNYDAYAEYSNSPMIIRIEGQTANATERPNTTTTSQSVNATFIP